MERVGIGNAEVIINTIPDFDTVVACDLGVLYDCLIPPSIITINDTFEISGCCGDFNLDNDVDGSDAAIFKRDLGDHHFMLVLVLMQNYAMEISIVIKM